jgi:acyl carrier protein
MMIENLEAGTSRPIATSNASVIGEEAIRAWLVNALAKLADIAPQDVDPSQTFVQYGLDSMQAARFSGGLEDWLGHELPPSLVYDYPTIETLARHLAVEGVSGNRVAR